MKGTLKKYTRSLRTKTSSGHDINQTPAISVAWSYKISHTDNQLVNDNRFISWNVEVSQSDHAIQKRLQTNNE